MMYSSSVVAMIIALWACSAVHATPARRTSSDPSQPPHYMDEPDESYFSIPVRQSILRHRGSQSASPPSADTQGTTISRLTGSLTGSLTRSFSTLLKSQIIAHTVPRSRQRQQQQQPVIASASTRPNRASSPPPHPPSCPAEYPLPVEYRYHADFPPDSQWLTWECLTATYRPTLLSHNGPDEVSSILSAIETTSHEAGIDPRIPFALIMQATSGNLRPPHQPSSHGLFQAQTRHAASCAGTPRNGCPRSTITAMLHDGVFGTHPHPHPHPHSHHLLPLHPPPPPPPDDVVPRAPGIGYWIPAEAGDVWRALRAYDSGEVCDRADLSHPCSEHGDGAFVSRIANWLQGAGVPGEETVVGTEL